METFRHERSKYGKPGSCKSFVASRKLCVVASSGDFGFWIVTQGHRKVVAVFTIYWLIIFRGLRGVKSGFLC